MAKFRSLDDQENKSNGFRSDHHKHCYVEKCPLKTPVSVPETSEYFCINVLLP